VSVGVGDGRAMSKVSLSRARLGSTEKDSVGSLWRADEGEELILQYYVAFLMIACVARERRTHTVQKSPPQFFFGVRSFGAARF
jgi:hypothetical protein